MTKRVGVNLPKNKTPGQTTGGCSLRLRKRSSPATTSEKAHRAKAKQAERCRLRNNLQAVQFGLLRMTRGGTEVNVDLAESVGVHVDDAIVRALNPSSFALAPYARARGRRVQASDGEIGLAVVVVVVLRVEIDRIRRSWALIQRDQPCRVGCS